MTFPRITPRDVFGFLSKLIALLICTGLPFWWFLTQLAEHGWN
jgi:hypothetical protein